jgi:hypothetical protein
MHVLAPLVSLLLLAAPSNPPVRTLEGQVVCSSCWDEADRKTTPYGTDDDLKCAAICSRKGLTSSLAVKSGDAFTLYVLEPGRFTPKGKRWLDYTGKRVEAKGSVRTEHERQFLRVDELRVLEEKK